MTPEYHYEDCYSSELSTIVFPFGYNYHKTMEDKEIFFITYCLDGVFIIYKNDLRKSETK